MLTKVAAEAAKVVHVLNLYFEQLISHISHYYFTFAFDRHFFIFASRCVKTDAEGSDRLHGWTGGKQFWLS